MSPKARLHVWLDQAGKFAARSGGASRLLPAAGFIGGVFLFLVLVVFQERSGADRRDPGAAGTTVPPPLSAQPSKALRAAVVGEPVDFESAIAAGIRGEGWVSVSLHVALYEDGRRGRKLGDGASPASNMYWGALFGVDNFLVNEAGWTRIHSDEGNGRSIVRRSIFRKTVEPTAAWVERGIEEPFDLFVLAQAWPHARIREAMTQPIREAMCGDRTLFDVDGRKVSFGAGSAMVGYLGQNQMLTDYWDPFAMLDDCPPRPTQIGVFYLAPRSGVLMHRPVVDHGLYSVLFAREIITPEAYIFNGMMNALISGELGDDFMSEAAAAYTRYQKSLTLTQAQLVLYR